MRDEMRSETERTAASEREGGRRATLIVIGFVGSVLIFRMTALIDPLLTIPSPVVYGLVGALFGATVGATQRADELEDRVLHTLIGAVVVGVLFVLFSFGGTMGPRKYRFR